MSEQLPPVGDYIGLVKTDIMNQVRDDTLFWEEITLANVCLNTPKTKEHPDPEGEAIRIVRDVFTITPYEQPVNIIGSAFRYIPDENDLSTGQYVDASVVSIEGGELYGFCQITLPDTEKAYTPQQQHDEPRYVMGIGIQKGDATYVFPIDRGSLMSFEMWDFPETDADNGLPDFFYDIRHMATKTRFETHTPDFYSHFYPEEQVQCLSEYLLLINDVLERPNSADVIYTFGVTKFYNIRHVDGAPAIVQEQTSDMPMPVTGEWCEAIIPELITSSWFQSPDDFPISEGEPMLALSTPNASRMVWIPLSAVKTLEIAEQETADTSELSPTRPAGYDLLYSLSLPNIFGHIKLLSVESETCPSREALDEFIVQMNDELDILTGVDICGREFLFSGTLYTQEAEEHYVSHHLRAANVIGANYDLRRINGELCFVIAVEYETGEIVTDNGEEFPDTDIGYIIPSTPHCEQLLVVPRDVDSEHIDTTLVEKLTAFARSAREITHSPDFTRASKKDQQRMLDGSTDDIDELLDSLNVTRPDTLITVLVRGCRSMPLEFEETLSPDEIPYVSAKQTTLDGFFTIQGDMIGSGYPESDRQSDTPYNVMTDFPISGGEPMVTLENSQTGISYLMRLSDIIRISPTFITEDTAPDD